MVPQAWFLPARAVFFPPPRCATKKETPPSALVFCLGKKAAVVHVAALPEMTPLRLRQKWIIVQDGG